jgi:heme/copper-type cytochrome/quinol oxidase subunit 3
MESSASAPHAAHIEAEPLEWQPRVMWVSARLLCGSISFFFAAFLFAYFYLRLLDTHHDWKIGKVSAPTGWGLVIAIALVLSAIAVRLAVRRPASAIPLTGAALGLALLAIVLQVIEWMGLGFGATRGGYASVFVGWTSVYAVCIVPCAYWIEVQWASARREARQGTAQTETLLAASLESCSLFWAYYVAIGVIAFIVLYLV